MSVIVKTISADEYLAFAAARGQTNFLQLPAWGKVKLERCSESIDFFDGDTLTGVGLALYRQLSKLPRHLAYLPKGPVFDWDRPDVDVHLEAFVVHARRNKAFAVRTGPTVVHHRWLAPTVKAVIADSGITVLPQATPNETTLIGTRVLRTLDHLGRQPQAGGYGSAAGQPRLNCQLCLTDAEGAALTDEQLPEGMNQLWRRNIEKVDKLGVMVTRRERADLARFHRIYLETAECNRLTGRESPYSETMRDALNVEEPDRMRIYPAEHEGDLVAATISIRVDTHTWYSYGASVTAKREVRGSNVTQRRIMRDARDAGVNVYDLRGITESLAVDDPKLGLIQFKVGTGGEAVVYLGEQDKPISSFLHFVFQRYLKRR